MPTILTLPKIGVNMTEAVIIDWLAEEGDLIEEGQMILEAETDKAAQEIPTTHSGILARKIAQPGMTVQIQEPIAVLVEKGEELPADFSIESLAASPEKKEKIEIEEEKVSVKETPPPSPASTGSRVRISPIAKKLSKDMNIDYTKISPSKPGSRIEKADVLAYARGRESAAEEVPKDAVTETEENLIPIKGIRKTIATRMLESVRSTARAVLFVKADAGNLISWRTRLNEGEKKVSYNDLIVCIAARALREFRQMNSRIDGDNIILIKEINVGVAVDTERGLFVPVIHGADKKDISAISSELQQKIERVRSGKSTREDISGGTFTMTNLGMFDVESFIPIINPPECAILAVGSFVREPVVVDDKDTVSVRPVVKLSLVWDHRIVDGAPAAQFLQHIKQLIEKGEFD